MKTLILNRRPGVEAGRFEAASGGVSRRRFLMGAGLAAGVMLVEPARALPGFAYEGDGWKETVCSLVDHVCPEPAAERIREAIQQAETYSVTPASDFHGSFSSGRVINARVSPEATYGNRFFEFSRLPYYDSRKPCRRAKDLNMMEIERILNLEEQEYYGGVVSPCSERRQLASCGCERNVYQKTLADYEDDPGAWEPLYVRNFTDGARSFLGFAVRSRANDGGGRVRQLLLSPDSV